MDFTPVLPVDSSGHIDSDLLILAEKVCIQSSALMGGHNIHVINAIKELLRKVNSYYSNKIESEGTHPLDIERAMKADFFDDPVKENLQHLSLTYIEVQKYIENYFEDESKSPFSRDFILDVHYRLYSKPKMEAFLKIKRDKDTQDFIMMVPGEFRKQNVYVGKHEAPDYSNLESLFNYYENYYKLQNYHTQAIKLIYSLSAHHRLTWLHPFLDGNGRSSRLVLDGTFTHIKLKGYGLWNISRGLSRESKRYKEYLSLADMVRQGDLDGRGVLSARGLKSYVKFMLETALDQIAFMNKYLKLDELTMRIEKYVKLSQEGLLGEEPIPKYSDLLLKKLLVVGELPRGKVKEIIKTKDRTATALIKKLIERDLIESTTIKSPIRLKFNTSFSSYLFPDLIPSK